jgi:hypothetical protein
LLGKSFENVNEIKYLCKYCKDKEKVFNNFLQKI